MVMACTLSVEWADRCWELSPQRALVQHDSRTVIVSDLHLGRPVTTRLPGAGEELVTDADTLDRLARLCEANATESLIILGGLFDAPEGVSPAVFARLAAWRERVSYLDIFNVRGDDPAVVDAPEHLGIEVWDTPVRDGDVVYAPEAVSRKDALVVAGGVHPAVRLAQKHHLTGTATWPAFVFGQRGAVLPAFNAPRGMRCVKPAVGDQIFAAGSARVADVSSAVVPLSTA